MPLMYEELIAVIRKPPSLRSELECQKLVPWFSNKSVVFETLKPEIIADVIRHCEFQRSRRDEVLIRQGDYGHKLFIILKGQVSIYVIQDKETLQETLQSIESVCSKPDLDRTQLGQYVWTSGEGKTVGEIALIKDDYVRTASVVVDADTDLVVIERELYHRSVGDVLQYEYKQKNAFVEGNVLFRNWPLKQRKSLVISLQKQRMKYGHPLTKQGKKAKRMFFILNGEVEITCDQSLFSEQYDEQWRDMETLVPGLLPRNEGITYTPHQLRRKRRQHRLVQMCLLGSNEVVGGVEILLGLSSSIENAIVTREADVLVLSQENYERLFTRKYAAKTVQILRECLTMRLYLYIHRSILFVNHSPFFKFLTFLLQDERALRDLKIQKSKEKDKRKGIQTGYSEEDDIYGRINGRNAEKVSGMLKMLDIRRSNTYGSLPVVEVGQKVIDEIEDGLDNWMKRSKGEEMFEGRTRGPIRGKHYSTKETPWSFVLQNGVADQASSDRDVFLRPGSASMSRPGSARPESASSQRPGSASRPVMPASQRVVTKSKRQTKQKYFRIVNSPACPSRLFDMNTEPAVTQM